MTTETSERVARIIRIKLYATPGIGNPKYAWKWLYDVEGLDTELSGFTRLDSAKAIARRYGATKIVLAWKENE